MTAQDATIAGYAEQAGRAMLLVANKWDLVEKDHARVKALKDAVAERFVFARRAPFLPISAKTGRGVRGSSRSSTASRSASRPGSRRGS